MARLTRCHCRARTPTFQAIPPLLLLVTPTPTPTAKSSVAITLTMAPGTITRQLLLAQLIHQITPQPLPPQSAPKVGPCRATLKSPQQLLTKRRLARSLAATTSGVLSPLPGTGAGGLTTRLAVLIAGTWATLVPTCIRNTIVATTGFTSAVSALPKPCYLVVGVTFGLFTLNSCISRKPNELL